MTLNTKKKKNRRDNSGGWWAESPNWGGSATPNWWFEGGQTTPWPPLITWVLKWPNSTPLAKGGG